MVNPCRLLSLLNSITYLYKNLIYDVLGLFVTFATLLDNKHLQLNPSLINGI